MVLKSESVTKERQCSLEDLDIKNILRAGKNRFSGTQKSVLLKASSGKCCVPHNFVVLVTLGGTHVCLIVSLAVHQMK